MKAFLWLFTSFVLLCGCATTPKLPENQKWLPLDPLQVKADSEVYGLRVDIFRVSAEDNPLVNDTQKQIDTAPTSDPSMYSWVGIDLGNGLFSDSHGNIAVDLVRLYGIQEPFHIEEVIAGLIPVKIDFQLQGGAFKRQGGGSDLPDMTATVGERSLDLVFYHSSSKASIYKDEDGITYDPHGLLGNGKFTLRQPSDNRVEVQGFLGGREFVADNDDKVTLGGFLVIRKDSVITIQQMGMISASARSIQYVRTDSGCLFSDLAGAIYEIKKVGDVITVSRNSKPNRTFKIIPSAANN